MSENQTTAAINACRRCEKEITPDIPKCPHCGAMLPSLSAMQILIAPFALIGIGIWALSAYVGGGDKTTNKRDPNKGFHCLSTWDGSHDGFKSEVKSKMKDPKSFSHVKTRITPKKNGQHFIYMDYRAKNSFGAVTTGTAKGKVDHDDCSHTVLLIK